MQLAINSIADVGLLTGRAVAAAMTPRALYFATPCWSFAPQAEFVARDMVYPSEPVIAPEGKTLIAGTIYAARLSAFDIEEVSALSNRRLWVR